MKIRISTLLFALLISTMGFAQPVQTVWPGLGITEDSERITGESRMTDCEKPVNTVAAGDTLFIELDISGGFNARTEILNTEPLSFGAGEIILDSLFRYTPFATLTSGGFDTVEVLLCNALDSCINQELIVGAGRAGESSNQSFSVNGGDILIIPFDVPAGILFCGSITGLGGYAAEARREARFLNFVPGDTLYYKAARTPGIDEILVVTCNSNGTCDSLNLRVSIASNTVDLPFCDDFSYPGPRPNPEIWLEDDVYVNDAFAIGAPSYGVASFDGLNQSGLPYGEGFGPTDQLTSTFIDASNTNDLYLKYFLQIGGRGQAPEQNDVMLVEAKNNNDRWVTLFEHSGSRTSTPDSFFQFFALPIDSANLKHDELQICFRVNSNLAGGFDTWNLDYVRVEEGLADSSFRDITLTDLPLSLLQPYTALPYSQFAGNETRLLRDSVEVGMANLFAASNNVSSSTLEVFDANGTRILNSGLINASQFNLTPGQTTVFNAIPPTPLGDFKAAAAAASQQDLSRLTTVYTLGIDRDQEQIDCVLRNDTVRALTIIDDYFAYDDGTAETGLITGGAGERIAMRFEAFTQDTLRGLRFQFPRLGALDGDRQLINLQVYIGELDSFPEYEEILVRPYYPSSVRDTFNAFTSYAIVDELGNPSEFIIPAGPFYVGWQQASDVDQPIPVGFDLEADNTNQIFAEYGFGWVNLPDILPLVKGSLMIRPVFSSETLENSSSVRASSRIDNIVVAPNPTTGSIQFINLPTILNQGTFSLHDMTGRVVQSGKLEREIQLTVSTGFYILRLQDQARNVVGVEKIVVNK